MILYGNIDDAAEYAYEVFKQMDWRWLGQAAKKEDLESVYFELENQIIKGLTYAEAGGLMAIKVRKSPETVYGITPALQEEYKKREARHA